MGNFDLELVQGTPADMMDHFPAIKDTDHGWNRSFLSTTITFLEI